MLHNRGFDPAALCQPCQDDRQRRTIGGSATLNGGLFSSDATPLLGLMALGDDVMAEALDNFSWEQCGARRHYINYRDQSM